MIDRSIAIRNVYMMLAYAFGELRSTGTARIAAEEFDHLHDLLAEILAVGVGSQVKRGLHRDYLARSEELATVRGRIDVTRSVGARTLTRGRLICDFDEYEVDSEKAGPVFQLVGRYAFSRTAHQVHSLSPLEGRG